MGGSTGTNLIACAQLIEEMQSANQQGSIITILCDGRERYARTYPNDDWLTECAIEWRIADA